MPQKHDTNDLLARIDRLTAKIKAAERRIEVFQQANATLQGKLARQRNDLARISKHHDNKVRHITRIRKILVDAIAGRAGWKDDAEREVQGMKNGDGR